MNAEYDCKGSSFDDFLKEEGIFEDVKAAAVKRVIVLEVTGYMEKNNLTKAAMARKIGIKRPALNRLLDPKNTSITLLTIKKIASVMGKNVKLAFD